MQPTKNDEWVEWAYWSNVHDAGPSLKQHLINASFFVLLDPPQTHEAFGLSF